MNTQEYSRHSSEYGRKLVDSGIEGARSGREEVLHGEPLAPYFAESMRKALLPAAVGACLGLLGSYPGSRRSASRSMAYGLVGGVLGFGAGVIWQSRRLGYSVVSGAMKNICRTRDEHWLEGHPIDYA